MDGSPLSSQNTNLGDVLTRINQKQPMNPPILSLNLERTLHLTIERDSKVHFTLFLFFVAIANAQLQMAENRP